MTLCFVTCVSILVFMYLRCRLTLKEDRISGPRLLIYTQLNIFYYFGSIWAV